MNQVIEENGGKPKPSLQDVTPQLREPIKYGRKEEVSPREAGIYASVSSLASVAERGAKAEGGENIAQLTIRTWLTDLLQKGQIPFYIDPTTMSALFFGVEGIDKTCAYTYGEPSTGQKIGDLFRAKKTKGPKIAHHSQIHEARWQSGDVFIVINTPLANTTTGNPESLIQAAVFEQEAGEKFTEMLRRSIIHSQYLTELINLMLGQNSFGIGGELTKKAAKNPSLISLPGRLVGTQLALIDQLQLMPNSDFGEKLDFRPKRTPVRAIAEL